MTVNGRVSLDTTTKSSSLFYLCGWTLKAIESSCHDINRCGTFENVEVEKVGSVSERGETERKSYFGFISVKCYIYQI